MIVSVIIALVINSSAYVAEIIRSGIQSVDKGQREAAKSLGMSNVHMMTKIIIPQAIKNILPALGNECFTFCAAKLRRKSEYTKFSPYFFLQHSR